MLNCTKCIAHPVERRLHKQLLGLNEENRRNLNQNSGCSSSDQNPVLPTSRVLPLRQFDGLDNIKTDFTQTDREGLDWNQMAHTAKRKIMSHV
jgi:hypothetical protein